jgi:hypothetical protein
LKALKSKEGCRAKAVVGQVARTAESARAQAVRTVGRAKVQAGEVPEVLVGDQVMKNEVQAGNDTHRILTFLIRLRTLYLAIFDF